MFRAVQNINILKVSSENIKNSFINLQIVRWRKPRWIPIAKSKVFRVPKRPVIPIEEQLEIKRLFNNYRTYVRSLRKHLIAKHSTQFQTSLDPEEILRVFKEDLVRCNAINDEWNAKQKELREKRVNEDFEEKLAEARKEIELDLLKEEKTLELVEEIVRKEKAASANFITPENIDAAIDKAVNEVVDYNFAIDINGEKIMGRETNPKKEQEQLKISVKQ